MRLGLIGLTPCFFALPVRQYGTARYWLIPVLAEWVLLAVIAWKRLQLLTTSRWRFVIHGLDLGFVFFVFLFTTRAANGTGIPLTKLVVVGTFQLQSYGPAVTAATVSGVWYGLGVGVISAIAYIGSLQVDGRTLAHLFNQYEASNTVSRALFYLVVGLFFGVLRDFVVYNRTLERRAYTILHNRGLSNITWLTDDLLQIANRGEFALHMQVRSGELQADIHGIGENLNMYLAGLRRIGAGLPAGMHSVVQICDNVVTNQLHSEYRKKGHKVRFHNTKAEQELLAKLTLPDRHASKLDKMLRNAITNCRNWSSDGDIHVKIVLHPSRAFYAVEVHDPGPLVVTNQGERPYVRGTGHTDAHDDAAECGWHFEFLRGKHPGDPSVHRVVIPLLPAQA